MKCYLCLSFVVLSFCRQPTQPAASGAQPVVSKAFYTNALGDSLCILEHENNGPNLLCKTTQDTDWRPFLYTDTLMDCKMDVRCQPSINGVYEKAWLQFLYPIRQTPDHWLETVAAYQGKQVPLWQWQQFFKGADEAPILEVIHQNIDQDPEREYVLWHNRQPHLSETCQSRVMFFDQRQGYWHLVKSLGPYFLPIQVRFVRDKKALEIVSRNVTSDGTMVFRNWVGI